MRLVWWQCRISDLCIKSSIIKRPLGPCSARGVLGSEAAISIEIAASASPIIDAWQLA